MPAYPVVAHHFGSPVQMDAAIIPRLPGDHVGSFEQGLGRHMCGSTKDMPYDQYSSDLWDIYRDEIQRLYIREHKTLREVISIMNRQGLRATPRMYKTRLKQWGMVKYNRRRKDGCEPSTGVDEPIADALQKPAILPGSARLEDPQHRLPSEMQPSEQYHTRLQNLQGMPIRITSQRDPFLLVASLSPPDTLRFQEALVGGFRELITRHYSLGPTAYRGVVPFLGHILSESRQTVNDLVQSSWLFGAKQTRQAGQRAKRAFFMLLDLLRDQNFYSLLYLFVSVPRWRDPGLLGMTWGCLASNAAQRDLLAGASSPRLSVLLHQIREFHRAEKASHFASAVSSAMGVVFDVIEDAGYRDDYCVTWLKCDYAWSVGLQELWVGKVQREVLSLRTSLRAEIRPEDQRAWGRSMRAHLESQRHRLADDADGEPRQSASGAAYRIVKHEEDEDEGEEKEEEEEEEEEDEEKNSLDDRSYDAHGAQAMCMRTLAQYQRALRLPADPDPLPIKDGSLDGYSLLDEAHWAIGTCPTIDDVRSLETWDHDAKRWEEVEAAKTKWVCGMWMLS